MQKQRNKNVMQYTDTIVNLHKQAATGRQLGKIQLMALNLQQLSYESGVDYCAPILFDVILPMTKKSASEYIQTLQVKTDEWTSIVRGKTHEKEPV